MARPPLPVRSRARRTRRLTLARSTPLRRRLLRLYAALARHAGPGRPPRGLAGPPAAVAAILAQGRGRVNAAWPSGGALQVFLGQVARRHGGRLRHVLRQPAERLRAALLALPGATPRLADAVLLHAAGRPVFVVDRATCRILARHRLVAPDASRADVQALVMAHLPRDPGLFAAYHAHLVRVGREYCRARPRCERCPLRFDLGGLPPRA